MRSVVCYKLFIRGTRDCEAKEKVSTVDFFNDKSGGSEPPPYDHMDA